MSQHAQQSVAFAVPDSSKPASPPASAPPTLPAKRIPWPSTWIILLSLSAVLASLLTLTHRPSPANGYFATTLATLICILAALFDAWTTRIPNPLTYTAALLGLALSSIAWLCAAHHFSTAVIWLGAPSLNQSLAGFAVCTLIAIVGIAFKVGGGDLKLFVALGALLGLSQLVYVSFVALSIAVLYSLVNLLIAGQLNVFARILAIRILELFYLRRIETFDQNAKILPKRLVPLGVPFAIGLILSQIVDLQSFFGGGL